MGMIPEKQSPFHCSFIIRGMGRWFLWFLGTNDEKPPQQRCQHASHWAKCSIGCFSNFKVHQKNLHRTWSGRFIPRATQIKNKASGTYWTQALISGFKFITNPCLPLPPLLYWKSVPPPPPARFERPEGRSPTAQCTKMAPAKGVAVWGSPYHHSWATNIMKYWWILVNIYLKTTISGWYGYSMP